MVDDLWSYIVLALNVKSMVRAKNRFLRFMLKNIGSAHFLRIPVTSYQSLQGDTEVVHGKCMEQDVRLFQKCTSLIVQHPLRTLYDNITNKTFITNFVEKTR